MSSSQQLAPMMATGTASIGNTSTRVVAMQWPAQAADVVSLVQSGRPVLLLVDQHADPPDLDGPLTDWIRVPAEARDIEARIRALDRRTTPAHRRPYLDSFGRLHRGGQWVIIYSEIEQRLLKLMLDQVDDVITHERLFESGWSGKVPTPNALRVHVARANRRIECLGLRIRSLRGIGYVIEADGAASVKG